MQIKTTPCINKCHTSFFNISSAWHSGLSLSVVLVLARLRVCSPSRSARVDFMAGRQLARMEDRLASIFPVANRLTSSSSSCRRACRSNNPERRVSTRIRPARVVSLVRARLRCQRVSYDGVSRRGRDRGGTIETRCFSRRNGQLVIVILSVRASRVFSSLTTLKSEKNTRIHV